MDCMKVEELWKYVWNNSMYVPGNVSNTEKENRLDINNRLTIPHRPARQLTPFEIDPFLT
jgi:hypothetical protein